MKLKPCPFCGQTPELVDHTETSGKDTFYAYVCPTSSRCHGSKMVMGFFGPKQLAADFWNNRATPRF